MEGGYSMTVARARIFRTVSVVVAGIALIGAAGALLGACGSDDDETTAPTTTATTGATGTEGAELPADAANAFIENCEDSARRSAPPGTDASSISSYCQCALDTLSEDLSLEEISELGQKAAETGEAPKDFERAAKECRDEIE
jgi:hypothetical protein